MKHDLQLFPQELNEVLIVTVRGKLGGNEGDVLQENHMVESYRAIRTDHEWLAEARGNQHGNICSETCRSQQGTEFTMHHENRV